MKISTKGRYGLEALVDLALHESEGVVSLKSIADRCGLSEAYILQIFLVLKKAGIISSVRGVQGGYILAKKAGEISVREVLEALEGPLVPVSCIEKDCGNPCSRFNFCVTRTLWQKIATGLETLSGSITIADLIETYNRIHRKSFLDYSI